MFVVACCISILILFLFESVASSIHLMFLLCWTNMSLHCYEGLMMATVAETQIQVRLPKSLKTEATVLFENMGMSLSEAVRTFLVQAVSEQGMPFRPHIPNKETLEAFRETENGGGKRYKNVQEFFDDMGIR